MKKYLFILTTCLVFCLGSCENKTDNLTNIKTKDLLIGEWLMTNTSDNLVWTFTKDGNFAMTYSGEVAETGTWKLVENNLSLTYLDNPNDVFTKEYTIVKINETELHLMFNGDLLTFIRYTNGDNNKNIDIEIGNLIGKWKLIRIQSITSDGTIIDDEDEYEVEGVRYFEFRADGYFTVVDSDNRSSGGSWIFEDDILTIDSNDPKKTECLIKKLTQTILHLQFLNFGNYDALYQFERLNE